MDIDLLVKLRLVQDQGVGEVVAAERVMQRLLEDLGPVGNRNARSHIVG